MLRQYAEEQLRSSADMEKAAHEAHAIYFADLMKACEMRLHDHRMNENILEIEADFDNIRVAWKYWANQQDACRLIDFIGALWLFFEMKRVVYPGNTIFWRRSEEAHSQRTRYRLRARSTPGTTGMVYSPDWLARRGPAIGAGECRHPGSVQHAGYHRRNLSVCEYQCHIFE